MKKLEKRKRWKRRQSSVYTAMFSDETRKLIENQFDKELLICPPSLSERILGENSEDPISVAWGSLKWYASIYALIE